MRRPFLKDKILIKSAWGSATFANPAIFVSLVEWADKVLTE